MKKLNLMFTGMPLIHIITLIGAYNAGPPSEGKIVVRTSEKGGWSVFLHTMIHFKTINFQASHTGASQGYARPARARATRGLHEPP